MSKRRKPRPFESLPVGLEPIYAMKSVNQPIKLYSGTAELEQDGKNLKGVGHVEFQWLPRPGLRFTMELSTENQDDPELEDATLHMLEISWHAKVSLVRQEVSSGKGVHEIAGTVDGFEVGHNQPVKLVRFHVPNFIDWHGPKVRDEAGRKAWGSRSTIDAGDWRITLDTIEEPKSVYDELKKFGGFFITNVGSLERTDGKKFTPKKTADVFEALFRYLSFCRGSWVAPILPVGFDENGDRVWEQWQEWKIRRWKNVPNWFDRYVAGEGLSAGFPGFYQRWIDPKWRDVLELSNHWYVESNMSSGGVEGSIILTQAAFEMLGWTYLVEEKAALGEKGYEKLDAADKLRLLLAICGIPAEIPASLSTLAAVKKEGYDGPRLLTEVRNGLVHSNPANRKKVLGGDRGLVYQTWKLALWYLELILLWIFNYKGTYFNRLAAVKWHVEAIESVPWL